MLQDTLRRFAVLFGIIIAIALMAACPTLNAMLSSFADPHLTNVQPNPILTPSPLARIRRPLRGKPDLNGSWTLVPAPAYAAFQPFGKPPYCKYGEYIMLRRLDVVVENFRAVGSTLEIRAVESDPDCPYPPLGPTDRFYTQTSQSVTRTSIDLTFSEKTDNIERSRAHLHASGQSDGSLSGTIVFRRVDSAPSLRWTVPIFIAMEPAGTQPRFQWKNIAYAPPKQIVTDALGTHDIPLGYQEQASASGVLLTVFHLRTIRIINASNKMNIIMMSTNDVRDQPPDTVPWKDRAIRSCPVITPLSDEPFRVGARRFFLHRVVCGTLKIPKMVETGNAIFFVQSPAPHWITLNAFGSAKNWDDAAVHEIVSSFR